MGTARTQFVRRTILCRYRIGCANTLCNRYLQTSRMLEQIEASHCRRRSVVAATLGSIPVWRVSMCGCDCTSRSHCPDSLSLEVSSASALQQRAGGVRVRKADTALCDSHECSKFHIRLKDPRGGNKSEVARHWGRDPPSEVVPSSIQSCEV